MLKGICYALGACFIWGLIFIVPQFMSGFSAIEITVGRYLCYGAVSSIILCRTIFQGSCRYPLKIWFKALIFSFASTIGYYIFVILALRYSTPAICAVILGISPITIAFYGNWKERECRFSSLILPSILLLIGLVMINYPHLMNTSSPATYLLGLVCALWALLSWSWYVVDNSRFLKDHPEVKSNDWSTLIGVSTIIWVIAVGLIFGVFLEGHIEPAKFMNLSPELISFLIGCTVLGFLCSWVGAFLWNRASLYLPVSLAGQLTIFETIFGVSFVYILNQSLPPLLELTGIVILLMAIVYGIHSASHARVELAKG